MTTSGDGRHGFLSRWSRLKREQAAAPDPTDRQRDSLPENVETENTVADQARSSSDMDDKEISQEEIDALPALETVATREDLAPFLRKGMPKALRNAAMRKMWSLNPTISGYLDPARDYAYDWNVPDGVPGYGGFLTPEQAADAVRKFLTPARSTDIKVSEGEYSKKNTESDDAAADIDLPETSQEPRIAGPAPHLPTTGAASAHTLVVEARSGPPPSKEEGGDPRRGRRHGGAKPRDM